MPPSSLGVVWAVGCCTLALAAAPGNGTDTDVPAAKQPLFAPFATDGQEEQPHSTQSLFERGWPWFVAFGSLLVFTGIIVVATLKHRKYAKRGTVTFNEYSKRTEHLLDDNDDRGETAEVVDVKNGLQLYRIEHEP
ncbi:hypothetical protein DIPPA_01515 [Diplonema papillatum]|nr:hypothetical protein DIPPA_01515 [Diplonema papillatum]